LGLLGYKRREEEARKRAAEEGRKER